MSSEKPHKQMMEADVEIHIQILGRFQESCRGEVKSVRDRGIKDTMERQLTWVHRGWQRLNEPPGSLHEMDLGSLHMLKL